MAAAASDEEQNEATYAQRLEMGQASLTSYGRNQDWVAYEEAARRFVTVVAMIMPGVQ